MIHSDTFTNKRQIKAGAQRIILGQNDLLMILVFKKIRPIVWEVLTQKHHQFWIAHRM